MNRQATLDKIRQNPEVSVLIIGAGINGIGTYRDLVANGVDTLIVDKGDFNSGASAASSHMLHGGIRYLENGEFRLVREALTERNLMLRNAPHYSKPLPTTVPMYRWFSGFLNAPLKFLGLRDKPAERGAAVIKIGLIVYDWFARAYRVMPTHTFRMKEASLREFPHMNKDIICTATYYDAWMPTPERISVDLVVDTDDMGDKGMALNYVSAIGASTGVVTLRDEVTGDEFEVKPKIVVNAGGPWIDFVNKAMNLETEFIGGTKGSHMIIDNPTLYEATNGSEIFFENEDGRIVLILPYMGKVMVGTTDIRIEDPEDARLTDDEIDYIISLVPKVFPNIKITPDQVIFHFTGVRPLAASPKGYTGNVTRDHTIKAVEAGDSGLGYPILSLVGGKWTSFRAFSEHTADACLQRLGRTRNASTQHMAIGGGKGYPQEDTAKTRWAANKAKEIGIEEGVLRELLERYGTRAEEFARFMVDGDDEQLTHVPGYTKREMIHLIRREQVVYIEDIVLRRSLLAWLGQVTGPGLKEMADICAEELGWSDSEKQANIERAMQILYDNHGVKIELESESATEPAQA